MSNSILSKAQIESFIQQCIECLESGDSSRLAELATLLQTLAMVTDASVFFAMPQSIGSYASELARFRTLVAFPILGEEDRKKCQERMKESTDEGVKGLQILKGELCGSGNYNADNIMKAIAKFAKQGYLMYSLRTQFTIMPGTRAVEEE